MAELSKLKNVVVRDKVQFHGVEVNVAYRPATEAGDREIFGGPSGLWSSENVRKFLVASLVEWDLTEDGAPVEITLDTLIDLPGQFNAGLFRFIRGLDEPDPLSLKMSSRSGSPGTES